MDLLWPLRRPPPGVLRQLRRRHLPTSPHPAPILHTKVEEGKRRMRNPCQCQIFYRAHPEGSLSPDLTCPSDPRLFSPSSRVAPPLMSTEGERERDQVLLPRSARASLLNLHPFGSNQPLVEPFRHREPAQQHSKNRSIPFITPSAAAPHQSVDI